MTVDEAVEVPLQVFVSCPSALNGDQKEVHEVICAELERQNLKPRTLGRSDYPIRFPLEEVCELAGRCSGGVILGFEQIRIEKGIRKRATQSESFIVPDSPQLVSTPWNQLEAGILFALGLPLLVFREAGISGGVFDPGVSDVFVQPMPSKRPTDEERRHIAAVIAKWQRDVRKRRGW